MTTWYPEGYPIRPKVFFPPGPPALSDQLAGNTIPYRYKPSRSSGTSGSSKNAGFEATMHPRRNDANAGYPQLDLVDGVDYFKIGDTVRIRRWSQATDSHTSWILGTVERPMLAENADGSQRRTYLVSYEDPRTKERREKIFSPHFQEITSLEADPVAATPPRRQDNPSNVVFAPIPILDPTGMKRIVYTPALVLTSPNSHGAVRLRVLAGPAAKRELDNFLLKHSTPYSPDTAKVLRQKGFSVEGDGTARYY
ncbi:hypothetical protein C8J57DRAFT_1708664 [Mycena rebaudengoi]|nr:hypothetical protein C8J57DRAFT_1708664 [Mycena rebaudengoi]